MKQKSILLRLCVCVAFFSTTFLPHPSGAQETTVAPLAVPSNLTASLSGANVVTLNWSDNSEGETGFKVYWRKDALPSGELRAFAGENLTTATFEVPLVSSGANTFSGPGVYVFKVQAMRVNANNSVSYSPGTSNESNPIVIGSSSGDSGTSGTSGGEGTPGTSGTSSGGSSSGNSGTTASNKPAAPTNLSVAVNGSDVTLTWTDNTSDEVGFKLYKNSGSGWTDIGNAPANASAFTHRILAAGTYSFRLQSFVQLPTGGFEYSYPSVEVVASIMTVNTPPATVIPPVTSPTGPTSLLPAANTDPDAPTAPTNLKAAVSGSDVILTWTDNATNETGFKLYRNYNGKGITDIGNVQADVTSFTDKGLAEGVYLYRLNAFRPVNGAYKYSAISNDVTVNVGSKQPETTVIQLTLNVRTVTQDNQPIPNIYVSLEGGPNALLLARKTDATGVAVFYGDAAPGVYTVRASVDAASDYLVPPVQTWEISRSETKDLLFVFKPKTAPDLVEVKGYVKLEDGRPSDATIWGWSDGKDTISVAAGPDGSFRFKTKPESVWHLTAAKESAGESYKSQETMTAAGTSSAPLVELTLKKVAPPVPSVVKTVSAGSTVTAGTKDGAEVTVPAGALSASPAGQLTLEIKPTVVAPIQAAKVVVSSVYDITLKDNGGNQISSFSEPIEVAIPYKEQDLKGLEIDERLLKPSYYDEQSNVWVPITDYAVDDAKNLVIAKVNHLTRFAIVMPADSTPPAAPGVVKAETLNTGAIHLTWKNPEKDFKYVRIFRSENNSGGKGDMIANSLASSSFVDSGVILGKTYYYLVKSVDPAGNESTNLERSAVKAAKGTAVLPSAPAASGSFKRDLKAGSKGTDVKVLQDWLKDQGFFKANSTAYYGNVTKSAVIQFQNRYAEETWKADKLRRADGLVRGSTRNKLNQMIPQ